MLAPDSNLRRPPKQERSRERVEEILSAAKQLIGEKGVDAVKMREIAALAGGPISSLYQYFPNKSSIISMLHNQWTAELDSVLAGSLESAAGLDDMLAGVVTMFDYYYRRIASDPAIMDLLNAIQADKTLNNVDIDVARRHAVAFCDVARQFIPAERFDAFQRVAFLMFQLAISAVRLALSVPGDQAEPVIEAYKIMIRTQLDAFARDA